MFKDIADKWTDALRSGSYEQGAEFLRQNNDFCCLGVLCDLYIQEHNVDEPARKSWMMGSFRVSEGEHEDVVLPLAVKEWSGMQSVEGVLTASDPLSTLNDQGSTFSEIADIIEERWEEL